MRFALRRLAVFGLAAVAMTAAALPAEAQSSRNQRSQRGQSADEQQRANNGERPERPAPLRQRANAGPCPYVKILYDAARYVELENNRASASAVGYTGEVEGVTSGCAYQGDEPITVEVNVLFNFGRGPQAPSGQHTYRYWIAVTERNNAVLAKQYFDLPIDFGAGATASQTREETIVIPRAAETTSGANFEVLVGFDITPEMAEFNRNGSRFRVNAGTSQPAPAAAPAQ